jgi:hypothetical protein
VQFVGKKQESTIENTNEINVTFSGRHPSVVFRGKKQSVLYDADC